MVKVAIAGGSGQVAKEVIDALIAANKHDITVLSRNFPPTGVVPRVHWRKVNYNDKWDLVGALRGIHTLLSFIQLLSDPEQQAQKNLIDAAIDAEVRRFAPSEYGSAGTIHMPWWSGKQIIREYLRKVNEDKRVSKYTLFQPGLFLDYLASPYKTAKHVEPLDTVFDFQNCRTTLVDGHENAIMTMTSVADLAAVVARAVEHEGQRPEIGGVRGNRVTFSQIVQIGEKIRGRPFIIEKVKIEDLEGGVLNTSWTLRKRHKAVPEEQSATLVKVVSIGILLSSLKGAWDVTDDLNQLFSDYVFDKIEDFLTRVWSGKS
ncbi:hypothetical protein AJ79_04654 [Helicocarpus griseus UAMH5409]|uniref:NmrA-like domain-containing protein n=1 Tax=Helicocarpus griseus UAMH5409 TaxID=1447875 RepID=A0A2B7XTP5_9EURO|nr:hypothetical protein AJ79_04654 [Helicocarpus griseus UAMH5409]